MQIVIEAALINIGLSSAGVHTCGDVKVKIHIFLWKITKMSAMRQPGSSIIFFSPKTKLLQYKNLIYVNHWLLNELAMR